jgi:hypothetical protein
MRTELAEPHRGHYKEFAKDFKHAKYLLDKLSMHSDISVTEDLPLVGKL